LAGIEFISLMAVVFITVNLVLVEMETRSIYLILSHPIERWQYIVGRYLGTIIALLMGMIIMALFHLITLFAEGWVWNISYLVSIVTSMGKIAIIGALALFLSLSTTSSASAMSFTAFLWVLGHFSSELKFMAEKSVNPLVKSVLWVTQQAAPNFSFFNYRDFWQAVQAPPPHFYSWMGIYTVCYIGTALLLSSWLFSKREF
jgi:ABC-type transport system involved in multi-copper enzyme maturation permease subunit